MHLGRRELWKFTVIIFHWWSTTVVLSAWSWISGILFTSIAPPRTQIALLTVELLHIVNQKQIGLKSVKLFTLFRSRLGNRIVTNLLLPLWLSLQQYLLMFSSTMVIPFILSEPLCFSDKPIVISNILSTIIFVAGIVTFLQSTFGCRWA